MAATVVDQPRLLQLSSGLRDAFAAELEARTELVTDAAEKKKVAKPKKEEAPPDAPPKKEKEEESQQEATPAPGPREKKIPVFKMGS